MSWRVPSPDMLLTSPSDEEPSSLHIERGLAITIQFPPGANGHTAGGGRFQATAAGPKQNAAPAQSVSVGVA